jgi:hypothetical protein
MTWYASLWNTTLGFHTSRYIHKSIRPRGMMCPDIPHMYTHMYTHVHTHVCECTYTCIHPLESRHAHMCVHVCVHVTFVWEYAVRANLRESMICGSDTWLRTQALAYIHKHVQHNACVHITRSTMMTEIHTYIHTYTCIDIHTQNQTQCVAALYVSLYSTERVHTCALCVYVFKNKWCSNSAFGKLIMCVYVVHHFVWTRTHTKKRWTRTHTTDAVFAYHVCLQVF